MYDGLKRLLTGGGVVFECHSSCSCDCAHHSRHPTAAESVPPPVQEQRSTEASITTAVTAVTDVAVATAVMAVPMDAVVAAVAEERQPEQIAERSSATEVKPKKRGRPRGPKKAMNSYLCFCKETRPKLKQDNPELKSNEAMIQCAKLWGELSTEAKGPYLEMAARDKLRHAAALVAFQQQQQQPQPQQPKQQADATASTDVLCHNRVVG